MFRWKFYFLGRTALGIKLAIRSTLWLIFILFKMSSSQDLGIFVDELGKYPFYWNPLISHLNHLQASPAITLEEDFFWGIQLHHGLLTEQDKFSLHAYKTNCPILQSNYPEYLGFCPETNPNRRVPTLFGGQTNVEYTDYVIDLESESFKPALRKHALTGMYSKLKTGIFPDHFILPKLLLGGTIHDIRASMNFSWIPIFLEQTETHIFSIQNQIQTSRLNIALPHNPTPWSLYFSYTFGFSKVSIDHYKKNEQLNFELNHTYSRLGSTLLYESGLGDLQLSLSRHWGVMDIQAFYSSFGINQLQQQNHSEWVLQLGYSCSIGAHWLNFSNSNFKNLHHQLTWLNFSK